MNQTKKLVKIDWLDSKGIINEWEYIDEIEPLKPCICTSVGYLIDDTDDYKTIVQTISDSQLIGRMTIPACSIKEIVEIKGE